MKTITLTLTLSDSQYKQLEQAAQLQDYGVLDYLEQELTDILWNDVSAEEAGYDIKSTEK